MKVTLELYCDQSSYGVDPSAPLTWELYVNGQPFPSPDNNILTTDQVDKGVKMLVDLEELMTE